MKENTRQILIYIVLLTIVVALVNNQELSENNMKIINCIGLGLIFLVIYSLVQTNEGFDSVSITSKEDDFYFNNFFEIRDKIQQSENCEEILNLLHKLDMQLVENDSKYYRYLYQSNLNQELVDLYDLAREKLGQCNEFDLPYFEPGKTPGNLLNMLNVTPI